MGWVAQVWAPPQGRRRRTGPPWQAVTSLTYCLGDARTRLATAARAGAPRVKIMPRAQPPPLPPPPAVCARAGARRWSDSLVRTGQTVKTRGTRNSARLQQAPPLLKRVGGELVV